MDDSQETQRTGRFEWQTDGALDVRSIQLPQNSSQSLSRWAHAAATSAFADEAISPAGGQVTHAVTAVAPFVSGRNKTSGLDGDSKSQLVVVASGAFPGAVEDGQTVAVDSRCVRLAALCRDVVNSRIDVVAARSLLPSTPNLSPAGIRISRKQVTVHYTFR